MNFLSILKLRNQSLFYFGLFCLLFSVVCLILMLSLKIKVLGINAYIKPFKFFISSAIFTWTMAWIMESLEEPDQVNIYSWMVILILSFETLYIFIKACQGQMSHFNISSAFNTIMYSVMGIAIGALTTWTGYIGFLFFIKSFSNLPEYYVWSIRFGIAFFVIFSFEGGIMAGRLQHSVGGKDGGAGLPLLNWSTRLGDLRVAHFIGMHALQLIPLIGFYFLKNTKLVILLALVYFVATSLLLFQAFFGRPFIKL